MADSDNDEALLRRFNALNKSTIISPPSSHSPNSVSASLALATRFRRLYGRAHFGSSDLSRFASEGHISAPSLCEPLNEYNIEDDKTFEELFLELEPKIEEENVKTLLEEARAAYNNTLSEVAKISAEDLKSSHNEQHITEKEDGKAIDRLSIQNATD